MDKPQQFKAKTLDGCEWVQGWYEELEDSHYIRVVKRHCTDPSTDMWENDTFPELINPDTLEPVEGEKISESELEMRKALLFKIEKLEQSLAEANEQIEGMKETQSKLIKLVKYGMSRVHRYREFQRYHIIKAHLNELLQTKEGE